MNEIWPKKSLRTECVMALLKIPYTGSFSYMFIPHFLDTVSGFNWALSSNHLNKVVNKFAKLHENATQCSVLRKKRTFRPF